MKNCIRPDCSEINPQSFDNFYQHSKENKSLSGDCKTCRKKKVLAWSRANVEKRRIHRDRWAVNNPEGNVACKRAWYERNFDRVRAASKRWQKENPHKGREYALNRYYGLIEATPPWLTFEQLAEIESFYEMAKELSWLSEDPLEVDHIVPIKGRTVRGLHVPWNLQIVPRKVNAAKGNKLIT